MQYTISSEIDFSGVGLHSGNKVRAIVRPSKPGSGFVFTAGGESARLVPGLADTSRNCTAIPVGGVWVMTVEHLLAGLWGMGVDNAEIAIEGGEAPGLDGSALMFAKAVREVGLRGQDVIADPLVLDRPVSVSGGKAEVAAHPSSDKCLFATYELNYPESPLARGKASFRLDPETFFNEIAPSRTFVPMQHVEAMRSAGLGKGANAQNTLVLDGDKVVDNELRFPDECVRHKILDLVGDLAVVGRRLNVNIVAQRSGHALNAQLAKALAELA